MLNRPLVFPFGIPDEQLIPPVIDLSGTQPFRPDRVSPEYARMWPRWRLCRDLMEGTEAIRRGGTKYLPAKSGEDADGYAFRRDVASLFNGFERTVSASEGILGVIPTALGDDVPQPIKDLWEDVTGSGMHGDVFVSNLVRNALIDGHAGIFVDASRTVTASSDVKARPYWIMVRADDEFLLHYETVNGARIIGLLVRRHVDTEREGLTLKSVTRYWVYSLGTLDVVYEEWVQQWNQPIPEKVASGTMKGVPRIPYARMIAGQKVSETETIPALMTLANLNIQHHNIQTNILTLEALACQPTPWRVGAPRTEIRDANGNVTGYSYPPLDLGPATVIEIPRAEKGESMPGQSVGFLSPDVSVIAPAQQSLQSTTDAMEASGSAYLAPQQGTRQTETATGSAINSKAKNSSLAATQRAKQDAIEEANGFSGLYYGIEGGSVTCSTDFDDQTLDAQTMTAYVGAVANAGLPVRILLSAWQTGGRISSDEDLDALEAEVMVAAEAQKQADAEAMQAQLDAKTSTKLAPTRSDGGSGSASIPAT